MKNYEAETQKERNENHIITTQKTVEKEKGPK